MRLVLLSIEFNAGTFSGAHAHQGTRWKTRRGSASAVARACPGGTFHFGHAPPAAGNGVYACSQARALTQLGHEVLVVAGSPPGHAPAAGSAGQDPPLAAQVLHVSGGPCRRWCGLLFACENCILACRRSSGPGASELSTVLRLLLQLCVCSVRLILPVSRSTSHCAPD